MSTMNYKKAAAAATTTTSTSSLAVVLLVVAAGAVLVMLLQEAAATVAVAAAESANCPITNAVKLEVCKSFETDKDKENCCEELKKQKSCLCSYLKYPAFKKELPANYEQILKECGVKFSC
ncbi:hypothetical protein Dimus_023181 [Dionaea muscipula]